MRRWLLASLAAMFLLSGFPVERGSVSFGVAPAAAQAAQGERKSLLRALFGRKKAKRKVVRKRKATRKVRKKVRKKATKRPAKRRRSPKRSRARAKAPAKAVPAKVAKAEDARTVLVAGDFYARSLVDGLEEAFADEPKITFVDETNGLSGFVRTDIVDWPATIGPLVDKLKPDYLIFMAGSNDRQILREDGVVHEKLSDSWKVAYRKRIDRMGAALKATDVPFTWVGLPSVRFTTMSRDFVTFNEWYGAAAAKSPKGKFTDIWDGFADANGNYSRSGPDINGQITLLRRKDGINMTDAGDRRLAFYVESDLRKLLDKSSADAPELVGEFDGLSGPDAVTETYDPRKTGRTIVLNLNDPSLDGGQVLAGDTVLIGNPQAAPQPAAIPVSQPEQAPPPQREGRVDDFSWPPSVPTPADTRPRALAGAPTPAKQGQGALN